MEKATTARAILNAALPLVPFDGWSNSTLRSAARAANISEDFIQIVFPAGVMDAIEFWSSECDKHMSQLTDFDFLSLRIPDKIAKLILDRFTYLQPHREAVRCAGVMMVMPWNAARAGRATFQTVDAIWKLAGITDQDFNWYTRRATLSYVYATTFKFWLSDEGVDMEKTAAYLKRRLDDVMRFSRAAKHLKLA